MKQQKQDEKVGGSTVHSEQPPTKNNTTVLQSESNQDQPKEYGGRKDGLDPTRYGDWEKNGRCIDF